MVDSVYQGHALDILGGFPDGYFDSVFTSPPYYFARDYGIEPIVWDGDNSCCHEWQNIVADIDNLRYRGLGANTGNNRNKDIFSISRQNQESCSKCGAWKGNLGQESHPDLYIAHLMQVFTECMRVLKPSGSLWINIDDSHASKGNQTFDKNKYNGKNGIQCGRARNVMGVNAKSLIGIPARLELAMIDAGWIVRNKIVWQKPNACPESATDRFTIDYEPIFFVCKNSKTLWWKNTKTKRMVSKKPLGIKGIEGIDWDWDDCRQCQGAGCRVCGNTGKKKKSNWQGRDYYFNQQFEPQQDSSIIRANNEFNSEKATSIHAGYSIEKQRRYAEKVRNTNNPMRNCRAVWSISTRGLHDSHFAVFCTDLAERVIDTSVPFQICDTCGLPREKIYGCGDKVCAGGGSKKSSIGQNSTPYIDSYEYVNNGLTTCDCENPTYHVGVILDPFGGSGSTAVQAKAMGRHYVLIDSNADYVKMAERRIASTVYQPELW
jgi:DNA modification methylase